MCQRMLNRQEQPDMDALAAHCGDAAGLFLSLHEALACRWHTAQAIHFPYGSHSGWCVSHTLGRKLLCNVFPEEGAFTMMLRLTGHQLAALADVLSAHGQEVLAARYPCGDGAWLHYRVCDQACLAELLPIPALRQPLSP